MHFAVADRGYLFGRWTTGIFHPWKWKDFDHEDGGEGRVSWQPLEYIKVQYSHHFVELTGVTYVDYAGSSLYLESHLDSFFNDLKSNTYGNPHSGNASSSLTHDVVEQVRFR